MAHGKGKTRMGEENSSMRTWQGIVILVAIAVILCAGIYIFACKAGYLPVPTYLERFLRLQERTDSPATSGELSRVFFQSLPAEPPETEVQLFAPEDADPAVLFAALTTPTEYQQRLRITEQWSADGEKRYRNVLLYVRGGQARIEKDDEVILFDTDAGTCYRGTAVARTHGHSAMPSIPDSSWKCGSSGTACACAAYIPISIRCIRNSTMHCSGYRRPSDKNIDLTEGGILFI